jgi:hypothetical protein
LSTYKELYQKVLFRLNKSDGRALLAAKEAVNDAHKIIARVKDFDCLMVLDTENAWTVADQSTYHLVTDWGLTNPKDLYTLRYMDEGSSRKLEYVTGRRLDDVVPWTEIFGTQKPYYYTRRGKSIELIPIPNEAAQVYVFYSQWPVELTEDDDESSYTGESLDDVVISLSTRMADASLSDTSGDWESLAQSLLTGSFLENESRPDRILVAQPFRVQRPRYGEWWKHPFILKDP